MNHSENYNDSQLQQMKERCLYMITSFKLGNDLTFGWGDIYKIALIEINRELDERKIQAGGRHNGGRIYF